MRCQKLHILSDCELDPLGRDVGIFVLSCRQRLSLPSDCRKSWSGCQKQLYERGPVLSQQRNQSSDSASACRRPSGRPARCTLEMALCIPIRAFQYPTCLSAAHHASRRRPLRCAFLAVRVWGSRGRRLRGAMSTSPTFSIGRETAGRDAIRVDRSIMLDMVVDVPPLILEIHPPFGALRRAFQGPPAYFSQGSGY